MAGGWAKGPTGSTGDIVARYDTDGSLDTSFAGGGVAFAQIGSTSHGNALAIQSDGSIVIAGYGTDSSNDTEFALARFQHNDPSEQTVSYDANGNMTEDQSGNTYGYDAWDRLATFMPSDASTTYQETYFGYNALGEQVSELDGVKSGLSTPVLVVNDGNDQRSVVDSLTVVFPQAVTSSVWSGSTTIHMEMSPFSMLLALR